MKERGEAEDKRGEERMAGGDEKRRERRGGGGAGTRRKGCVQREWNQIEM